MILNAEQLMIRDMARRFAVEQLAPFAGEWDRECTFPAAAIREMGELGLLGMLIPQNWDGAGADHVSYALALEEIAAGDGATSTIMSVQNSVACMPLYRYGSEVQKERWLKRMARGELLGAFCLTEPHAGSDAAAIRTRARRSDRGWILNGTKQFVISGVNAQLAIVFAVTDPSAGKRGISAFVVPTDSPGYRVASIEKKLGQLRRIPPSSRSRIARSATIICWARKARAIALRCRIWKVGASGLPRSRSAWRARHSNPQSLTPNSARVSA